MPVKFDESSYEHGAQFAHVAVFCVIGIAVNYACSQTAVLFNLPLYLDSVGTVIAAVLGGYIPGIVVGYVTNLINGLTADDTSFYYAVLNVLIAVCAAYFANRGWFKRPLGVLGAIVAFAIIGGGLGAVLSWAMFGGDFGTGDSAALAHKLFATGYFSTFSAQLTANLAYDLADKAITVAITIIIVKIIPERFQNFFDFRLWRQTPLTDKQLAVAKHAETRSVSLGTRIVALISAIMLTVAVVTTVLSFMMFHDTNISEEKKDGESAAELVAHEIDGDRVDEYLAKGAAAEGYTQIEDRLAAIRASFPDIQYVYVYQIREDGCHVVFDLDTEELPGAEPGEVVPFDEAFSSSLDDLLQGKPIEPIISNESYGWLLTHYEPVRDSSGKTVCYAAIDISMDRLMSFEGVFLARLISLFAAFFILICAFVFWLAEYRVILPVNTIAAASRNFAFHSEQTRAESVKALRDLNIRTGDELENLYQAVTKTSEDTVQFIAEAQEKAATIERMQQSLIAMMADLIESRDHYTGNHVRNTAAYTQIIMQEMHREGLHPDVLTDEFMKNVVNSAPLHDVGKIKISDTVLNKPGRLTPEEFENMKTHTTEGKKIIEDVADAVSESGYLEEAENLATYHHEKWDGSGYPYGLAGEEIPLSARIMAVADVFDALVSKRSYKEGMPVDKALSIIEEGLGSHFDPEVARAFLNVSEEARAIAEASNAAETKREHDLEDRPSDLPEDAHALDEHHDERR